MPLAKPRLPESEAVTGRRKPALTAVQLALADIFSRLRRWRARGRIDAASIPEEGARDPLTGLPSRAAIKASLTRAIADGQHRGDPLAVLVVDLDNFRIVNDALGWRAGDALLSAVGCRLLGGLCAGSQVCRAGDDEFVVILVDPLLVDPRGAAAAPGAIRKILEVPFEIDGHRVAVTSSVGIGVYPRDGADPDTLLRSAYAAMFQAKLAERDSHRFHQPTIDDGTGERAAVEAELRRALTRGEFLLHYQPQVEMRSGRIVGAEALIRWRHPERQLLAPAEFMPVAERCGLTAAIGEWALRTACARIRAWNDAGFPPIRVAVNLTSADFLRRGVGTSITSIVAEAGVTPGGLEIELTESTVMSPCESVVATLQALKGLGVRIAIDDFGTGYSSLGYLKRLPIDTIKIDRAFVRDLPDSAADREIVRAIMALARGLAIRVIAEGVETKAQFDWLRENGCDEYQGFLFSAPVDAAALELLLGSRAHAPRTAAAARASR